MNDTYENNTQADLEGPGQFDLGDVIERSRSLVAGSKRYGVYLFLTIMGVLLGLGFVTTLLFVTDPSTFRTGPWWWDVATGAFASAMVAMLTTSFGLHRAQNSQLSYSALFKFIDKMWPYLALTFPATLLTALADGSGSWLVRIGVSVVVFPVAYAPYFMIDRALEPLRALERAYSLVFTNIGQFLLLMLLSVALSVLVVITLGFGLIWVGPFFIIVQAVIYDEAVGIRGEYRS